VGERTNTAIKWLIVIGVVAMAWLFGYDGGRRAGREEGRLEQIQFQNDLATWAATQGAQ
jgi:hypothetical protein